MVAGPDGRPCPARQGHRAPRSGGPSRRLRKPAPPGRMGPAAVGHDPWPGRGRYGYGACLAVFGSAPRSSPSSD